MYIADYGNYRIRKITASTGIITTIAGTGASIYSGDNGAATSAGLRYPVDVTTDDSGAIITLLLCYTFNSYSAVARQRVYRG